MIQALAKNPADLIERGAPHRIHSDEQLAAYTRALFRLTAKEVPTDAEQETIELLTLLIEEYESRYRMPQPDPLDVLKYLIQKGGLRQQDLRAELGSVSNVSMILSGRRKLTLEHASALAERFHMDIRAFLPAPALRSRPSRRVQQPKRAAAERSNRTTKRRTVAKAV